MGSLLRDVLPPIDRRGRIDQVAVAFRSASTNEKRGSGLVWGLRSQTILLITRGP